LQIKIFNYYGVIMKILITASDFLAKAVAKRLKELNHDITIQTSDSNLAQECISAGFRVLLTQDPKTIEDACNDKDAVINCSGLAKHFGVLEDFKKANVDLVKIIINGCTKANAKLVHISSPSVFMNFKDLRNISEDHPFAKPINDYAKTKAEAESLILKAVKANHLKAVILRSNLIVGPGDEKILGGVIRAHQSGGLPLFKQGKALLDLTYIDNAVDAIILSLQNENANSQIYHISNGEPQPVIDVIKELFDQMKIPLKTKNIPVSFEVINALLWIAEKFLKALHYFGYNADPFFTRGSVSTFAKDFTLDITKAKQELGYDPKVTLKEGLKRYAIWYKTVHPIKENEIEFLNIIPASGLSR